MAFVRMMTANDGAFAAIKSPGNNSVTASF